MTLTVSGSAQGRRFVLEQTRSNSFRYHFGVTEKFLRCMHAPRIRCSYHSGHAYHSALYQCMHAPCMHRACMRMTSTSASRTYLCDPITVVSQRDCSSHACARTILSCWRMQAYHSVLLAHARCTHVPFYPSTATVHTLHGRSPHHFWRTCVHARRMRRHTHIPFCPARA